MVVVLIGVTLVTFLLVNVVPGDPARVLLGQRATEASVARVRSQLGLDQPLHIQYWRFLKGAVRLDFGESYFSREPVTHMIFTRFGATARIAMVAYAISLTAGIIIGVLAAYFHGSFVDTGLMSTAALGFSVPGFWLAMLGQIIFGVRFNLLPVSGLGTPLHYVMPAIALAVPMASGIARMTRTSVLDVLGQDYVRTARAKGLSESWVLSKHALKNALIPIVTLAGMQISGLLGGSLLIERVFSIPGLGSLVIESVMQRDIPLIQGTVVYMASLFVLANLLVDLSYAVFDPRVQLGEGA